VIRQWLSHRPFELWGYWPVDAEGVDHHLPHGFPDVMRKYNRNLAYSEWARTLMKKDDIEAQALPHGIDTSIWYPRDRKLARKKVQGLGMTRLGDNSLLVGVVATNQPRKDWALAFATCAELLKQGQDVLVWCHTDTLRSHWDIVSLVQDFGLLNRVMVTHPPVNDEDMAQLYSACDVTLGIGLGEGFGYPIFESLACGTPCVHGNYGGAAEHLSLPSLVEPCAERIEGQFNCVRPVFDAADWAHAVSCSSGCGMICPTTLDWNNLWPKWEAWFRG
jgi:glycosyltransferase involved in cell wall biosynthesis